MYWFVSETLIYFLYLIFFSCKFNYSFENNGIEMWWISEMGEICQQIWERKQKNYCLKSILFNINNKASREFLQVFHDWLAFNLLRIYSMAHLAFKSICNWFYFSANRDLSLMNTTLYELNTIFYRCKLLFYSTKYNSWHHIVIANVLVYIRNFIVFF